ncbi:hypothetical protein C1H46_005879 [Malus baccata]|uniref:Uncharacterized protein n=1 Tax=Malus baccata TaxID=106549 RepID=A0A540ND97_MALBA|nr:hypothetical protein C1H46_005879 [Malus baccata]
MVEVVGLVLDDMLCRGGGVWLHGVFENGAWRWCVGLSRLRTPLLKDRGFKGYWIRVGVSGPVVMKNSTFRYSGSSLMSSSSSFSERLREKRSGQEWVRAKDFESMVSAFRAKPEGRQTSLGLSPWWPARKNWPGKSR